MWKLVSQSVLEGLRKLLAVLPPKQTAVLVEKAQSFSLAADEETGNHRIIAPRLARHGDRSGFFLLDDNLQAFVSRSDLIRKAERTLDLQYYYFHGDTSGHLMVQLLVMAANRGVRIRVLLDDIETLGADEAIRILNAHPEIEIRIFNPFKFRGLLRYLEFFTDMSRVGRRMHNKVMIADNCMAIFGGRNIGDIYFSADPQMQFMDIDLLGIGPIVRQISDSFDEYWNSDWAIPVDELYVKPKKKVALQRIRNYLNRFVQNFHNPDFVKAIAASDYRRELFELPYEWAHARLMYDSPEKIQHAESSKIVEQLRLHIEEAREEIILVSPYFVPGDEGVAWLSRLVEKGISISVYTNSLAATDVIAVHAGYARHRKQLLRAGVKLYELKPTTYALKRRRFKVLRAGSRTSLHAKTIVIDRSKVFIGSSNLDPRSNNLNTEMGVLVEHAGLAREVAGGFEDVAHHAESYQLLLQKSEKGERIVWLGGKPGDERRYYDDPHVSFGRRAKLWFYRQLPFENLL